MKRNISSYIVTLLLLCAGATTSLADVTNVDVSLSNQVAGDDAVYTITFTLGTTMGNNDTYTITFPTGTVLPTSLSNQDVGLTDLTTGVTKSLSNAPTINGQVITIKQPNPQGSFVAGDLVQIVIGKSAEPSTLITNPPTQGTNYTLTVYTSEETTPVTSSPYTVIVAEMTPATVTLGSSTTGATQSYQFDFSTSKQVNETEWFHIVFGAATTLATPAAGDWRISGNTPSSAAVSGQRLSLQVPADVSIAPGAVTVSNVSGYDVTNPSTPSSQYTVDIFTSTNQLGTDTLDSQTTSETYTITSTTAPTMGDVTVTPSTVSSLAEYVISSATLAGATMVSGDVLTYTFPSGTTIPSSISTDDVTLTHDGGSVTINSVTTDVENRQVAVELGASLAGSGPDTLTISSSAGIANPSTSGTTYQISLHTTLQPNAGTSNNYSITTSATLTPANVVPSPNTFKTGAGYNISFSVGSSGALTSGSGTITLTFPNDTQIPVSIDTFRVTVNSVDAYSISTNTGARTITITTGTNIANNASVTVAIDASAGVVNPTSVGSYTISVATSSESSQTSNSYSIEQSTVTAATITPSSNQPLVTTPYTIDFYVGSGGNLVSGSSSITINFHDSVGVSATIAASDITVNSTAVVLSPTINTTTKTITLTSPVSVSANGAVSITIGDGITNPSIGTYYADIYTSVEETPVRSDDFSVNSGTSITDLSVSLDNSTVSASAVYTVTFTATNAMQIIQNNDTHHIYVDLPDEVDASALTKDNVTITANSADIAVSSLSRDASSELLNIEFTHTGNDIAQGATVVVDLGDVTYQITNPSTAKGDYYVKVHTSADANPVQSHDFVISTTTALTSVSVTPSPSTANTIASYSVALTTAASTQMVAGVDTFFVRFPGESTVPSTIANSTVKVNGSNATSITVVETATDTLVKIVTPVTISASSSPSISIGTSAEIRNPDVAKTVTWQVYTSTQPTAVSDNVEITAITDVSPAVVTPSPATAGQVSQYAMEFTNGGTALASGDTITVTFPSNTNVPSSIDVSSVSLTEESVTQTVTSVITSPVDREVGVIVGEAVAAGASITLTIETAANVINPTTAGNNYTLTVAATNNGSSTSNVYSITATETEPATVTPSPSTESATAQYTVSFDVGTGGALSAGANSITITFPTGTTVPSYIDAGDITVNGTPVSSSPTISDREVTLTTPVNISSGGNVSVVFSSSAGIVNPSLVSTGYTVRVHTSKEPTDVTSLTYSITRGTDVAEVVATPNTTTASTASTYSISFKTGTSGMTTGDTLYTVFPTGTTIPASITASNVTVGGSASSEVLTIPSKRMIRVISGATVSASTTTTLAYNGTGGEAITNPTAGSNYTLTLRVDSLATPITSSKYTITSGTQLASVTVTPSPATTSATAAYTVKATTSSDGALAVGDSIVVVFPSATTIPSSIPSSAVWVDGNAATYAPVIDQGSYRVAVVTPTAISASTQFTLTFASEAGIVNPSTATNYTANVSTNIQTTAATSSQYTISVSTDVTSATVALAPTTVNLTSQYTLSFTLGTTALSSGDTVSVTFPTGTTVPATIDTSTVTLKDDGTTRPKADTDGVFTNPSTRTVYIRVGGTIAASSAMEIVFSTSAGVVNPETPGNSYTLDVAATGNGSANSGTYSVTASTVNPATVTPVPTTDSQPAQYTIDFTVGSGGALTAGSHTITIIFPSGTTVPSSMVATHVTVNGTELASSPTCDVTNRKIILTTPVNVANNGSVSIVFSSDAGIENPSEGTNYSLYVLTSKETTSVQSNSYSITSGSSISSVSVSLGTSTASTNSTYSVSFTTGTSGISSGDSVYVKFPSGTTVPASITASNVTVNGVASSEVLTFPATRLIRVIANTTVSASSSAAVAFNGTGGESITNPATTGSGYTLTARVDSLSTPITSAKYTITSGTTLAAATVTVSPTSSGSAASYTIATTTAANGALGSGDSITVVFPTGTTVPSSISPGAVAVNGTACTATPAVTAASRQVKVISPTSVGASSSLSLSFNSSAGIVNPTVTENTNFALDTLYTSIQPVGQASSNYTITPASKVSAATVTPAPATISAAAQYTLSFNLGNTGPLNIGVGTITVIFSTETTVPGTISKSNVTVNDVIASDVVVSNAVDSDADTVVVTVGATVDSNAAVSLVFKSAAGITNPATTGNYTLTIYTSQESTPVASNVYTINPSTVSTATVTLSNQLTSQASSYTVAFNVGSAGALTSGSSTISLTLPDGTTIGGSVARTSTDTPDITVNTTSAANVTVSGQIITITSPVSVAAGGSVSIVISSGTGMITNPSTANNNYQISVKTSEETTLVPSSPYPVTETTTVSGVAVSLGTQEADSAASYTITFDTGSSGALSTSDSIIVTFPSGTGVGSAVARSTTDTPDITVNSTSASVVNVNSLTVTVACPTTVSASSSVSLVFSSGTDMLTNPSETGSNKTVAVRTTPEPDPISSSKYTINTTATTLTAAVVTVNPATLSDSAAYTMNFSTGSKGALRAGDTFTITLPAGTTVPASIDASNLRVNGTAPTEAPTVNAGSRIITLKTPVAIDTSASVELTVLRDAGIENPGTAGYYTLTVASSIEVTAVTSESYPIGDAGTLGNIVLEKTNSWSQSAAVSDSFRVLLLKLTASNADLEVTELKLQANGTGDDLNDVAEVQLYNDANGNGTLDSPTTVDTLITTATFAADGGVATFTLDTIDVTEATPRYLLVYYKFGSTGVSGETFYPTIANNTFLQACNAGEPLTGDSVTVSAPPITGGTLTMATATVTPVGAAENPSSVEPGTKNVKMLKVTMTSSTNNAILQSITVANTVDGSVSTFDAADIDSFDVYLDNGNGSFTAAEETYLGGAAVEGASGGTATVTISSEVLVGTTGSVFYLTYDIASGANTANSSGMEVTNITVASPSTVAAYTIGTTSETTLPVELTSFTAAPAGNHVKIEWVTASEVNNVAWRILRMELPSAADTTALAKETYAAKTTRVQNTEILATLPGKGTTRFESTYDMVDMTAVTGKLYAYYLIDVDIAGRQATHGPVFASTSGPREYELGANYPNPFNPTTTINFALPFDSNVRLTIYNTLGQEVTTLIDGLVTTGYHNLTWNGRDANGRPSASGVYLYRFVAVSEDGSARFTETRRMLMVR